MTDYPEVKPVFLTTLAGQALLVLQQSQPWNLLGTHGSW